MSVIEDLTEEEAYLWAIISDPSGLDLAEWSWTDEEQADGCFRAWPFQWKWFRCTDQRQIDQMGRGLGKSLSIKMRAYAFPFLHPGQEMVITAPEGVHLDAVTDNVETIFLSSRLGDAMVVKGRSGIKHRPFHINFVNGSRIMGRIPQLSGKGLKGTHPLWLETDEASDFPAQGWVEIIETLKMGTPGAVWRCIAEGQLVLTFEGWKPIEKVEVGNLVLTHKQRWRRVIKTWENDIQECVSTQGNGHPGLISTADHKFYVRGVAPGHRRGGKQLQSPGWISAKEFKSSCPYSHWSSPTSVPWGDGEVPPVVAEKGWYTSIADTSDLTWLWLYGLYIAEGYGCNSDNSGHNHRRFHWCVNDEECDLVAEKLASLGLKSHFYRQGKSVKVIVGSSGLYHWLTDNAGVLAHNKEIAKWVFGLNDIQRQAIFDGMTYGDGSWSHDRTRWEYVTVSKKLALGMKLLGQSLGYVCNPRHTEPRESIIEGRTVRSKEAWCVQMTHLKDYIAPRTKLLDDGLMWSPIEDGVHSVGPRRVYDLEVEEDHSYIVEGIVVSNCHGVTRGMRDHFYKFTQPDSGWTVHRATGMHRPTWNDEERQAKMDMYGSRDHPDYRRNILGLHGDATNPLFVLHRLMQCVDAEQTSTYNTDEYQIIKINNEMVLDSGDDVLDLLDYPEAHIKKYKTFWIGMDIGLTLAPSSIMIFAEENVKGVSKLRLLCRVMLERISNPAQVQVILHTIAFYKPQAFSMDRTGIGLPMFQDIQNQAETVPGLKPVLDIIKGYNFSSKILVDFDQTIDVDQYTGDAEKEAGMHRNVLEYCVDAETECFTKSGWKTHDQLEASELILTLDPQTKLAEWQPVEAVNVFDGDRKVLDVQTRSFSSVSTMNHNWVTFPVSPYSKKEAVVWNTTADLVNNSRIMIMAPGAGATHKTIEDAVVRVVAWLYTEGWWGHGRTDKSCGFGIAQSFTVYPEKVDDIRQDLTEAIGVKGFSESKVNKVGMITFWVNAEEARKIERHITYPEKCPTPAFLSAMTQEQALEFIRVSIEADGCGRQFMQTKRYHAEAFMTATVMAGIPARMSETKKGTWCVELLKRGYVKPVQAVRLNSLCASMEIREHTGIVWCPTTAHGTWLARRRGTTYFTGNSSDKLRQIVDENRMIIPWDKELIAEFQGSTWSYDKSVIDMYGRRKRYNKGDLHNLDAARMAVLGYVQYAIEVLMKKEKQTPVTDIFLTF